MTMVANVIHSQVVLLSAMTLCLLLLSARLTCARLCLLRTIARLDTIQVGHNGSFERRGRPTAREDPRGLEMDHPTTVGAVSHGHAHEHAHEDLGFCRTYVFSVDHKVIGIQSAITGLLFLLFGFTLMMIMRFQLAYPGRPIPLIGSWLGAANAPGGIMLPEFYNQLGAMPGTVMVLLGVVPLAVAVFGPL